MKKNQKTKKPKKKKKNGNQPTKTNIRNALEAIRWKLSEPMQERKKGN
jgi:hypothetical protein